MISTTIELSLTPIQELIQKEYSQLEVVAVLSFSSLGIEYNFWYIDKLDQQFSELWARIYISIQHNGFGKIDLMQKIPFYYIPVEIHKFMSKKIYYAGARKRFDSMYIIGDVKSWDFIALYA